MRKSDALTPLDLKCNEHGTDTLFICGMPDHPLGATLQRTTLRQTL